MNNKTNVSYLEQIFKYIKEKDSVKLYDLLLEILLKVPSIQNKKENAQIILDRLGFKRLSEDQIVQDWNIFEKKIQLISKIFILSSEPLPNQMGVIGDYINLLFNNYSSSLTGKEIIEKIEITIDTAIK